MDGKSWTGKVMPIIFLKQSEVNLSRKIDIQIHLIEFTMIVLLWNIIYKCSKLFPILDVYFDLENLNVLIKNDTNVFPIMLVHDLLK